MPNIGRSYTRDEVMLAVVLNLVRLDSVQQTHGRQSTNTQKNINLIIIFFRFARKRTNLDEPFFSSPVNIALLGRQAAQPDAPSPITSTNQTAERHTTGLDTTIEYEVRF